jgi:Yip1-like protein
MTTDHDAPPIPPPGEPQPPAPPVVATPSWDGGYGAGEPGRFGGPPGGAPPAARGERLSPWVSIFTKPRATMRQILDENPRRFVHRLAMLGGIAEMLGSHIPPMPPYFAPSIGTLIIVKLFLGAIVGVALLYIGSAAVLLTGRWLGGRGDFVAVRAASAWSSIPAIWGAILWVPMVAYLGLGALNLDPESLFGDPTGLVLLVPIGIAGVVLAIWRIVIYFKCLGEAHGFSAWHAFGATLIACVLLAIPFSLMAIMAVALGGLAMLGGSG